MINIKKHDYRNNNLKYFESLLRKLPTWPFTSLLRTYKYCFNFKLNCFIRKFIQNNAGSLLNLGLDKLINLLIFIMLEFYVESLIQFQAFCMWPFCQTKDPLCFDEVEIEFEARPFGAKRPRNIKGHPNPPFPQQKVIKNGSTKSSLRILRTGANRIETDCNNEMKQSPLPQRNSVQPLQHNWINKVKNTEKCINKTDQRRANNEKGEGTGKYGEQVERKSLSSYYSPVKSPLKNPLQKMESTHHSKQPQHPIFNTDQKRKNSVNEICRSMIPQGSEISTILMKADNQNRLELIKETFLLEELLAEAKQKPEQRNGRQREQNIQEIQKFYKS